MFILKLSLLWNVFYWRTETLIAFCSQLLQRLKKIKRRKYLTNQTLSYKLRVIKFTHCQFKVDLQKKWLYHYTEKTEQCTAWTSELIYFVHRASITGNVESGHTLKTADSKCELLVWVTLQFLHARVRTLLAEMGKLFEIFLPAERKAYEKRSERRKHCALAVVRRSQKISPRRRPPSRGAGWPKFNQLKMVTTLTYKPSLMRIDAGNFELSW